MDTATLQHLVDRQAINDVLQRYARGIDAFQREHAASTSWHQHLLTVVEVVIDGDRATALTYLIAHMVAGDPGETVTMQVGDYRDELIRTDAGWRIARRVQRSGLKERRSL